MFSERNFYVSFMILAVVKKKVKKYLLKTPGLEGKIIQTSSDNFSPRCEGEGQEKQMF